MYLTKILALPPFYVSAPWPRHIPAFFLPPSVPLIVPAAPGPSAPYW